jgi:hypothetical protein
MIHNEKEREKMEKTETIRKKEWKKTEIISQKEYELYT